MPVFNQLEYTVQAINSVIKNTQGIPYELIVINNGSTDGTTDYLNGLKNKLNNIKVFHFADNKGFASATNMGLGMAKVTGFYLLLNNDVIVTPNWLTRLIKCYEEAPEKLNIKKIGFVGPSSNIVAGLQKADMPQYYLNNLDQIGDQYFQENFERWAEVGFLSGLCLLIKKEVIDEIGLLDTDFDPGGYDDNDIILRGRMEGYKAVLAGDVFIHHFGHKTLDSEFPDNKRGVNNKSKYYRKYHVEDYTGKLVAMYRIKNCEEFIKRSLIRTSEFADEIVVLDDGSKDNTVNIVKEFPKVAKLESQDLDFNERRDRNKLLEMAKDRHPDWIISIDGDEVLEDKFDYDYAHRLIKPVNPEFQCFRLFFYTFWRGEKFYRKDGIFGNMSGFRLFKNLPNQEITLGNDQGLHCGNIPMFPIFNSRYSGVRVKHYGYSDPKICKDKFDFYSGIDKDKREDLIGAKDYNHLIDESKLQLNEWNENNQISLCIVGKDEEFALYELFDIVWSFVDEIIYVDTGSKDNSKQVAKMYGAEVYDYEWNKNYSDARNFAKSKATKEWILHLDPDEEMPPFPPLLQMVETDFIAWLFMFVNLQKDGRKVPSEHVRLFRNLSEIYYEGRVHESLENSLKQIENPKMGIAPFLTYHKGFMKDQRFVSRKLNEYFLLNQMQMKDNPEDSRPYFNLALHYLNDGDRPKGIEYLHTAMQKDNNYWQPRKELFFIHLEEALKLGMEMKSLIPKEHPFIPFLDEMLNYLSEKNLGRTVIDTSIK